MTKPGSVNEVQAIVRDAAATGAPIYPQGGKTRLELLTPPGKPGIPLYLTGLNRVLDYPFQDMTITVEAGITLAELQKTLASHQQWIPIDVPFPERATLGGSVAANTTGLRRASYGTWRDYVIGVSFINDQGDLIRAGGRVVKNVAGYDFCKLLTGSWGTLGIITELTFKVRPLPESTALILIHMPVRQLSDALKALRATKTRPVVQAIHWQYATSDSVRIMLGFEESRKNVDWQLLRLQEEWKVAGLPDTSVQTVSDDEARKSVRELDHLEYRSTHAIFHAGTVRSQILESMMRWMPVSNQLLIDIGTGFVIGETAQPESIKDALRFFRLPQARLALDQNRADVGLMKQVKLQLDPKGIFNPSYLF